MTQTRLRYFQPQAGPGHPHGVMRDLAKANNLTVIQGIPQFVGQNWFYWIAYDGALPSLPAFLQVTPWLAIGKF